MKETAASLCSRLGSNDPTLTVLKSREVEDYNEEKLIMLLETAISSNSSVTAFYAEMDDATIAGWELLGRYLVASTTLEKLWIWSLRSGRSSAAHLSHFFRIADPRRVSIQGLGLEIQEPERAFTSDERDSIQQFFALNTSITIVNILCEVRFYSEVGEGYSFLDCVLTGLCYNTGISHLILRHSDMMVGCTMKVSSHAVRAFLRQNKSVHYLAILVGNNDDLARSLAEGLRQNCSNRHLNLHNMSDDACEAFLAGLGSAQHLRELTLVDCALTHKTVLDALSEGLQRCVGISSITIDYSGNLHVPPPLDEILQVLAAGFESNTNLMKLSIAMPKGVMGPAGALAVSQIMGREGEPVDIKIVMTRLSKDGGAVLRKNLKESTNVQSLKLIETSRKRPPRR